MAWRRKVLYQFMAVAGPLCAVHDRRARPYPRPAPTRMPRTGSYGRWALCSLAHWSLNPLSHSALQILSPTSCPPLVSFSRPGPIMRHLSSFAPSFSFVRGSMMPRKSWLLCSVYFILALWTGRWMQMQLYLSNDANCVGIAGLALTWFFLPSPIVEDDYVSLPSKLINQHKEFTRIYEYAHLRPSCESLTVPSSTADIQKNCTLFYTHSLQ